ncbi:hypothetical protein [Dyadobacter sp.]|uniref:hypothetical protein n=1 Tax=Dyadobacter sp. TaxID=1914288 RepID=UPI003F6F6BDA
MPSVKNQDSSGKLEKGVILSVSDVENENDAILAVENYLREKQTEQFELAVPEKSENGTYEIRLG